MQKKTYIIKKGISSMNCYEQHNNIWVEHLTTHLMLSANPTHYTGRRGARKKNQAKEQVPSK